MAASILSELSKQLNLYIETHVELENKLLQTESLARMAEITDSDQISKKSLHYYFMTMLEIVESAVELNQLLSDKLSAMEGLLQQQTDDARE